MKRTFLRLVPVVALACGFLVGCGAAGAEQSTNPNGGDGGGASFGGAGGDAGGESSATPTKPRAGGNGAEKAADVSVPQNGAEIQELPQCTSALPSTPYYMSADDSNSMASPAIARELLNAGLAPNPTQIRTYEFLNYYNALYDIPAMGDGLGVHVDLQQLPGSPTEKTRRYRLQVGVQAFQVPRVPLVITYVIDTSGSLVGAGLARERQALLAIGDHLQEGDIVNVVTWSTKNNVLLEGYVATGKEEDQGALAEAVTGLLPGGGSDLHGGLTKAYELAQAHFDVNKLNRVVLLSDGGANLGVLDRDVIAAAAEQAQEEGIYLVGVGVGPAKAYSDTLMDLVTDAGRGAYVYLDSPEEATRVFDEKFDEIMNVAARNVRVEVDLPPYLDIEHFYAEKYSEDSTEVEPQNLAPGDSMILNQTLFVTDVNAMCGQDVINVKVLWETPIEHEQRVSEPVPVDLTTLLYTPMSPQMQKANAVIAYAEALKTNTPEDVAAALATVQEASKAAPEDKDLEAIADLIQLHPALQAN